MAQALLKIFGGDHKPKVTDLHRTSHDEEDDEVFCEEAIDVYQEDDGHMGYYDYSEPYSGDFEDGSICYQKKIPEELEAANEEVDHLHELSRQQTENEGDRHCSKLLSGDGRSAV